MRTTDARTFAANGGIVLNDPEGEINRDTLVAEEIDAFEASVGLKEVPEISADAH